MKKWIIADIVMLFGVGVIIFANYVEPQLRIEGRSGTYIRWKDHSYQLIRDGSPYHIKGVSLFGIGYLSDVVKFGGNSIRLYSTDNAGQILDSAHKLGLTVMLGLELPKAGAEADYSDTSTMNALRAFIRSEVEKYKDHPALLCWGLGNEVDIYVPPRLKNMNRLFKIWKAMDGLAAEIKKIDRNHPITVSIPAGRLHFRFINAVTRNIDLISFNSFTTVEGGIIWKLMEKCGLSPFYKPHFYTELGPNGYWASEDTEWFSKYEPTSKDKSAYLAYLYNALNSPPTCMGSYFFFWGYKQEFTPTWFSMYTAKGEPVEVLPTVSAIWKKDFSNSKHGSVQSIDIDRVSKNVYLEKDARFRLRFSIDSAAEVNSGYAEIREEAEYLTSTFVTKETALLQERAFRLLPGHSTHYLDFTAPSEPGAYRAYLFIRQKSGFISTANISFYVLE
jgi:hypothetical protein